MLIDLKKQALAMLKSALTEQAKGYMKVLERFPDVLKKP